MRVPDFPLVLALLKELGEPLISSTLILPNEELAMNDAEQIRDALQHKVDLVIDGGATGLEPTTVIDLTGSVPVPIRIGKGDVSPFLLGS